MMLGYSHELHTIQIFYPRQMQVRAKPRRTQEGLRGRGDAVQPRHEAANRHRESGFVSLLYFF